MAFANFSILTAYNLTIAALNTQITALASLFRDQAAGDFTNQIRYSSANKRLEYWTGSAWAALDLSLIAIAQASNADTLDGSHAIAFATAAQGTKADNAQPAATAINTGNIGSQSVNYASSAGSATNSSNADTLDGQHGSYYLNAANHTGVAAAATMPVGSVIQIAVSSTSVLAESTATMPLDNTIPQITEGWEVLALAFTPLFANSKILIEYSGYHSCTVAGTLPVAVFQSGVSNAIGASVWAAWTASGGMPVNLALDIVAVSTSARTYSVRTGSGGAKISINGVNGVQYHGGAAKTTLRVFEIKQ